MPESVRPATNPATVLRTSATRPCRSVRRSARRDRNRRVARREMAITARSWARPYGRVGDLRGAVDPAVHGQYGLRGRPGQPSSGHPVARHEQPERQAGVIAVAREPSPDLRVAHGRPADQPRVLRPRPRIEDQQGVPPDRHHDVRGGVRSHARQREEPLLELLVGQLVRGRRSRAPPGRARRRRRSAPASAGRRPGSPPGPRLDRTPPACRPSSRASGTRSSAARYRRSPGPPGARPSRSPCAPWRSTRSSSCRPSSRRPRRRSVPGASCRHRSPPTRDRGRARPSRRSPTGRDRGAAPDARPRPCPAGRARPRPARGSR